MHFFIRNYSSYYWYIFSSTDVAAEAIMDHPSYITWLATTTYTAVRMRHIARYSLHKNICAFHIYKSAEIDFLSILMSSGTKDFVVSRSQQSFELSLHLIRFYSYYIHVWHNACRLVNRVAFVGSAVQFSQSASTLHSSDTGPGVEFWQCVIKRDNETISTRLFRKYQDSGLDGYVCVLVEHKVIRLQSKRLLSVTSIWSIFLVVSIPAPRYSLW